MIEPLEPFLTGLRDWARFEPAIEFAELARALELKTALLRPRAGLIDGFRTRDDEPPLALV